MLALDVDDVSRARDIAARLAPLVGTMKIGPGLFIDGGRTLIEDIKKSGNGVFLDLKIYDIPETVARACRRIAALGIGFLTVHASGGSRMISAARDALKQSGGGTKLLAVTVLTSFEASQLKAEWKASDSVEERVLHLARLAREAGADGVVCSPLELSAIRREMGGDVLTVVPGIRAEGSPADDQRRTLAPAEALAAGADYLVVGRPIMNAPDPVGAAREILAQMEGAPA